MRMRKVPRVTKLPKGHAPGEPFRHPDHPRPTTRRQFLSQGFITGSATVLLPSIYSLLANPRIAQAAPALPADIQTAVTTCGIKSGAGLIPFICFDLSGGANIAGSNVLVGGPTGQMDFLSVAGYSKLGLPGSMVPNASATGNFVDSSFGLRYHSDSAQMRGIKTKFTNTAAFANVTGTIFPALSQNDTNTNPHNPMYGIWQAGARGALLDLIGTDSSVSGGNSMAPPNMVNAVAQPTVIQSGKDTAGLVSTGQLAQLLPNRTDGQLNDVTRVLASMKRISDAKTGTSSAYPTATVQAYADPTAQANAMAIQACAYTKAAYLLNQYPDASAVNPDADPSINGGIFTTAEYQSNGNFQKTAAVMKLVIDGDAAAGTIELGGYDYHSGNRMDGEAKDFEAGQCIGAVLQYAALQKKPVMIYVFTDGSLASDGTIDNSVGGRGKGVWTADNQNVAATYFLVYNPGGVPQTAQANVELSKQIGFFNPDGSQNTTSSPAGNNVPNLVQMVILNYLALHSANDLARWPTLWPGPGGSGPNIVNTLGTGSALDPLVAWQPLPGLTNGRVVG